MNLKRIRQFGISIISDNRRFLNLLLIIVILSGGGIWLHKAAVSFGGLDGAGKFNPLPFTWNGSDFGAYYRGAKAFMDGSNIYNQTGFVYPPLCVLLFVPLAYLSLSTAGTIMFVLNVIFLLLLVSLCIKILKKYKVKLPAHSLLKLFLLFFFMHPVLLNFSMGQINIAVTLLAVLAFFFLFVRYRPFLAGFMIAAGAIMKVWPIILMFLGFFISRRKGWESFFCTVLAAGILSVFSFALFGIQTHVYFVQSLRHVSGEIFRNLSYEFLANPHLALVNNKSPAASLVKAIVLAGAGMDTAKIVLMLTKLGAFVLFGYSLFRLSKTRQNGIVAFALLITFMLAISNTVWTYYATFLILPFAYFVFANSVNYTHRILILLSTLSFSVQTYVTSFADVVGGWLKVLVHIINPSTFGFLFLSILFFYAAYRRIKYYSSS